MSDLDALPSGRPAFDPAILMRRLTSLDAIFAEMKAIPTRSGPRRDLPISDVSDGVRHDQRRDDPTSIREGQLPTYRDGAKPDGSATEPDPSDELSLSVQFSTVSVPLSL